VCCGCGCRGGVVDGARQALLLTLAALGPPELNRIRIGAISPPALHTLRLLRDFLGVTFDVRPEAASGTVLLSCIGCGMKNLGRRVD
jgi:RNA 3'-terminal phosphate cyclase-like protein